MNDLDAVQLNNIVASQKPKKVKKSRKSVAPGMMSQLNKLNFEKSNLTNAFSLLFDEITDDVAKEVVQWIIESSYCEEPPECLNMVVNSPGGSLTAAFAIIDVMKSCHIPIRTIGLGQISSAGLMIFMSGTKGMRVLTPNTSIMSHAWSGGSVGKVNELFAITKEFELTSERMIKHYIKHTGLKEKQVMEYLLPAHDVYLSAKEAKEHGLCDVVALLD